MLVLPLLVVFWNQVSSQMPLSLFYIDYYAISLVQSGYPPRQESFKM